MSITLYHHPFSRASNVVWMLEEVGCAYTLRNVDIMTGGQKAPEILALNPMGKLPILVDGDAVVTESAAIGLYLADRYAIGRLAPAVDDPARGAYLRWALFGPSVVEPAAIAKRGGWAYGPREAGWGEYEAMLASVEHAIGEGPWVLGDRFTMVDVILGGLVRYMLRFDLIASRPAFVAYAERLGARPALQRADARNAAIAAELGLGR